MFVLALVGVAVNLALIWVLGGHHHGPGGHSHGEGAHAEHGASQRSGDGGALDTIEEGRPAAADAGGHAPGSSHGGRSHDGGGGGERNINVRGAVIHVVGDLVQSLGVAVAGALIWAHPGDARWALADPVCTFVFAALVLWTTLAILRDIADVLMERTPRGVSADAVSRGICGVSARGLRLLHRPLTCTAAPPAARPSRRRPVPLLRRSRAWRTCTICTCGH